MSPSGRAAAAVVRGYQRLAAHRRSPCRFVPSCSCYARSAFEDRGLGMGGLLAAGRVLRCNPWGPVGWDPVPGVASPPSERTYVVGQGRAR